MAFLIYRPIILYEESITPYLICNSRRKAEKIRREIVQALQVANDLLLEEPERNFPYNADEEELEKLGKAHDEKYWEIEEKNEEIKKSFVFPYGLDKEFRREFNRFFKDTNLDAGQYIEIMELPLY